METKTKKKGRGWLVAVLIILFIRLISVLGEKLSDGDKMTAQDRQVDTDSHSSGQDRETYADREYANRDKEGSQEDRKQEQDGRGRSSDSQTDISSSKQENPVYTIAMPGSGDKKRVSYDWSYQDHKLRRQDYKLVFHLLRSLIRREQDILDDLSQASLEDLGIDPDLRDQSEIRFQLALWQAAYREMYLAGMEHFDPLIAGLNDVFKKEGFTDKQKLDFLVTFVQNIRYERPGGDLDVLPPMVTLSSRYGDCDTKSLLLYVILEKFGYDCVIMWSQHYKHAMLGIYTRAGGDYKEKNGRKYYFLETTYPGWVIGKLPPKWDNTRYWYTIKL